MMIEAEYKTQNSRDVLLIPLYLALTMGAMNIPMLSFFLSVFILINIQPTHSDVRLIFSLIAGVSLSLMAAARPVAFEQFSDTDVYYGKIGRAHVGTPVTNDHYVCRLLL